MGARPSAARPGPRCWHRAPGGAGITSRTAQGRPSGSCRDPLALGIPVASAMCLLQALAHPAETPLCPSPGKGTTLKPPWPLWGKATVLQGW